jgi:hypothetical protein
LIDKIAQQGYKFKLFWAVIDLMKGVQHKSGGPAPPPEPRPRAVADQEVVQLFVAAAAANPAGDRRSKGGRTAKGRKIHALVECEGRPMRVLVHSAAIQDRDGAGLVLDKICRGFPCSN